jgi:DNA-binding NarL/FixJ family response regulator
MRSQTLHTLSSRESHVAHQIAKGESLKGIAYQLSISVQAVSTYVTRVKTKLGVNCRPQLVALITGRAPAFACVPLDLRRRLTDAEAAIASAILSGCSSSQIATMRSTSRRTVEHQTSNVMRKLGLTSRAELIAAAFAPDLSAGVHETGSTPTSESDRNRPRPT